MCCAKVISHLSRIRWTKSTQGRQGKIVRVVCWSWDSPHTGGKTIGVSFSRFASAKSVKWLACWRKLSPHSHAVFPNFSCSSSNRVKREYNFYCCCAESGKRQLRGRWGISPPLIWTLGNHSKSIALRLFAESLRIRRTMLGWQPHNFKSINIWTKPMLWLGVYSWVWTIFGEDVEFTHTSQWSWADWCLLCSNFTHIHCQWS